MEKPTGVRYAVIFRTHFWDDYAERQYRRLLPLVGPGDLHILANETDGPVDIPHDRVFRYTLKDSEAFGLASYSLHGPVFWFNGDYPLYLFADRHPDYDYYVAVEYDVVTRLPMQTLVAAMERQGLDLVGLTQERDLTGWVHLRSCIEHYPLGDVRKQLLCLSGYSSRAIRLLSDRRRALSRDLANGRITTFPYSEAFVPTEVHRAGFSIGELSDLGSTRHYDVKPAIAEWQVRFLGRHEFLHPVLDVRRFLRHRGRDLARVGARRLRALLPGRRLAGRSAAT